MLEHNAACFVSGLGTSLASVFGLSDLHAIGLGVGIFLVTKVIGITTGAVKVLLDKAGKSRSKKQKLARQAPKPSKRVKKRRTAK
jgi:hypothetical protein